MPSALHVQSNETADGGGDGERPDDGGRSRRRHDRRHLPREGHGEQRGERPHGSPRPLPGRRPGRRQLVGAEADEQKEQGEVRPRDEEDGGHVVAPGAVDGEARVDGEQAEPRAGDQCRRRLPAVPPVVVVVVVVRHG